MHVLTAKGTVSDSQKREVEEYNLLRFCIVGQLTDHPTNHRVGISEVEPVYLRNHSSDEYQQTAFATPYLIMGDWMVGGDVATDARGTEFTSVSKYHFEAADGSTLIPAQEEYILRGDHTTVSDPTTVKAEIIRKVEGWGMDMFGAGELPDWRVLT
ncbi:MAG: hypothetical protein HGA41_04915 [Syntrophaceae bacterium]|nr:hypothetical protein [Syntrophaceae bacterium]